MQIKVLINDIALLLDLLKNSEKDQIIDMNSHFLSGVYCASKMEG